MYITSVDFHCRYNYSDIIIFQGHIEAWFTEIDEQIVLWLQDHNFIIFSLSSQFILCSLLLYCYNKEIYEILSRKRKLWQDTHTLALINLFYLLADEN